MKKFFCALLGALTLAVSAFGLTACGGDSESISVYMPDGATALSMAAQMTENKDFGKDVKYHVVDASAIPSAIGGESPLADICVLPLNTASSVIGDGAKYQMLGTVTHGNLYLLKKSGNEDITIQNLYSLVGKTVGVVQLAAVPGLTFQLILKDNGVPYAIGEGASDKVNLKALADATAVSPSLDCDYFVVPEPAATTKVNKTPLEFAGDLQKLYGGGNGYPQAVLVVKRSLIESDPQFIEEFKTSMTENANWLKSDGIEAYFNDITGAINAHRPEGKTSSINSDNLNAQVIKNCAVRFVPSSECKEEVNSFLDKLIAVNPSSAKVVSESFFYIND